MESVHIGLFLTISILFHISWTYPVENVLIDEILTDDYSDDVIDLSRFGDAIFGDPDEMVGKMVDEWSPESDINAEELGTYFEGDILIPNSEGRNGLVKESTRWKNNVIPYVFHSSVPSGDRQIIRQAIAEYHAKTCLRFVERTNERDYISFESSNSGCWSSVGRIGGKQTVNLQSGGCTRLGTVEHEIMHALGFLHEQNRYDRDDFVVIQTQNIKPSTLPNFEKARSGETTAYGVPYDKGSVMHYSPTAFSRNGQKTIVAKDSKGEEVMGQRKGFAPSDLKKINSRYCPEQSLKPAIGSPDYGYVDYNGFPNYGQPFYPDGPPFYGPPGPPPNGPYPGSFYPPPRPPPRPLGPFRPPFFG